MPRATFTSNLRRHLACEPAEVPGRIVAEALDLPPVYCARFV